MRPLLDIMKMDLEHAQRLTQIAVEKDSRVVSVQPEPPSITPETEFMDIEECHAMTGIPESYLYQLTSKKKIPHIKMGKAVRFHRETIREWMLAGTVEVRDEEAEEALAVVKGQRDRRRKRLWSE